MNKMVLEKQIKEDREMTKIVRSHLRRVIKKLNLERLKEYEIEMYPRAETVKANYLGLIRSTHVFENKESYILVSDDWIMKNKGIISYNAVSSASIGRINKGLIEIIGDINTLKQKKEIKNKSKKVQKGPNCSNSTLTTKRVL